MYVATLLPYIELHKFYGMFLYCLRKCHTSQINLLGVQVKFSTLPCIKATIYIHILVNKFATNTLSSFS